MFKKKLQVFIILLCWVYTVFSDTSFIPKGQRAEIFELTDNEVPVFRITLPNEEFITLKEKSNKDNISTILIQIINQAIKSMVETINNQNLFEAFPNTDFTEVLPELPITEKGYPNIDYTKYFVDNISFNEFSDTEFLIMVYERLNNNSYLNLLKVIYVLSESEMSPNIDESLKSLINEITENIIIDENGEIKINIEKMEEGKIETNEGLDQEEETLADDGIDQEEENISDQINTLIKYIIETINEQNFFDAFPNTNFTEVLPELPLNEKGYPTIDYTKYFINEDDLQKFDKDQYILFTALEIINDDSYLNIIKIVYILSELDMATNIDDKFKKVIKEINSYIKVDENGKLTIEKSLDTFNDGINYYYDKFKNFNSKELYELIKIYNINDHKTTISNYYKKDFKTKNATMIVEMNNQKLSFDKITFSIGGQYSSTFPRPGFNVKIRGNKELFGRRQFKLRADSSEPSYMRTKLMCDIHDRLGIPSLSANYATLYINDEYMGLYIFTDAFKESWIEYTYGEKDTTQLYKGESAMLTFEYRLGFKNENDEITDNKELYKFLAAITKANNASDIESVLDLDQFYKEVAISLLTYGWDHISHNYYIYKNPQNGKWIYFIHDFDFDLGVELGKITNMNKDLTKFDFKDMEYSNNINKIILSDSQRFNETLKEIVINAFNLATLFPRIDELKTYIEPYVKLDKTPNENGDYPGVINKGLNMFFSFKEWEDSTENEIIRDIYYGLKEYILLRYRYVCQSYGIECDPKYLDETMELPTNKTEISTDNESTSVVSTPIIETIEISSTTTTSTITSTTSPTTISETPISSSVPELSTTVNCYSEIIGYSCCQAGITTVYATDEYGDWGYDFSKKEWCGLTKYEVTTSNNEAINECWSEALGYPCCKGCKVYETDSDGSWGYEMDHWCGIIPSQCQNK